MAIRTVPLKLVLAWLIPKSPFALVSLPSKTQSPEPETVLPSGVHVLFALKYFKVEPLATEIFPPAFPFPALEPSCNVPAETTAPLVKFTFPKVS